MLFMCRIMGHRRSGTQAYFDPEIRKWRSVCHRCRVPMVRERKAEWYPIDERLTANAALEH